MIRLTITTLACSLVFLSAIAQDPKAQEILKKVNSAITATNSFQYDYEYNGWGKVNGKFTGTVKVNKEAGLQLLVELNTLNNDNKLKREEIIYVNGDSLMLLDRTNKALKFGTSSGGSGYLSSYIWYTVFRESIIPNLFEQGINDVSLTYEGKEKINGVECHIVGMNNPWGDRNFWYFGTSDFQIYGQRQESLNEKIEGGFIFKLSNLKYNHQFSPEDFTIEVPEGFSRTDENERIIGIGEKAPDWSLKNGANKIISNRDLKGKVVVFDFWASWCSPCWKTMPIVDDIKADYSSKNVEVFGINVWENPKLDVEKYLIEKKLNHYKVLFDANADVAKSFKIGYLPLIVVMDTQGTIVYLNNGLDEKLSEKIRSAIDKAL